MIADPSLTAGLVEETMRYDPGPDDGAHNRGRHRAARRPDPGRPEGRSAFISANRDERKFRDAETFDIRRNARDHLGFGGGLHSCLGAALARLEARIAIEELLKVAPDLSVDESGLRRMHSPQVRGYTHVPVSFTVLGSEAVG